MCGGLDVPLAILNTVENCGEAKAVAGERCGWRYASTLASRSIDYVEMATVASRGSVENAPVYALRVFSRIYACGTVC